MDNQQGSKPSKSQKELNKNLDDSSKQTNNVQIMNPLQQTQKVLQTQITLQKTDESNNVVVEETGEKGQDVEKGLVEKQQSKQQGKEQPSVVQPTTTASQQDGVGKDKHSQQQKDLLPVQPVNKQPQENSSTKKQELSETVISENDGNDKAGEKKDAEEQIIVQESQTAQQPVCSDEPIVDSACLPVESTKKVQQTTTSQPVQQSKIDDTSLPVQSTKKDEQIELKPQHSSLPVDSVINKDSGQSVQSSQPQVKPEVKVARSTVPQKKQQQQNTQQPYPSLFTTQGLPNVISKKVLGLVDALNQPEINMHKIKAYLAEGIPDEAAVIREYCWKIILGYLPDDKKSWESKIQAQEKTYQQFVKLFLSEERFADYPILLKKDHPRHKELEEDFNLWEQIEKDTSRTHAELSFFCTPAAPIMIPFLTSPRREKFRIINGQDEQEYKDFLLDKQKQRKTYKYDYMTRILFIYAKLNPRILYVQGMNQILAPIFYLANSGRQAGTPIQQAACFYMFNNAISDIIELHIKDLDKSENGIYGKLNQVNEMLVVIEPRVWSRLESLKIDPFFYCFRWMTLLFAQDFQLFDTLRIWQSIFSSNNRLQFMNYLALSIIISGKQIILANEFTVVLQHLQSISEHVNIDQVIHISLQLYTQFKGYNFKEHAKKSKTAIQKKKVAKQNDKNSISGKVTGNVNKLIKGLNKFFD